MVCTAEMHMVSRERGAEMVLNQNADIRVTLGSEGRKVGTLAASKVLGPAGPCVSGGGADGSLGRLLWTCS
eukprot:4346727-Amphidinium_carterae.1